MYEQPQAPELLGEKVPLSVPLYFLEGTRAGRVTSTVTWFVCFGMCCFQVWRTTDSTLRITWACAFALAILSTFFLCGFVRDRFRAGAVQLAPEACKKFARTDAEMFTLNVRMWTAVISVAASCALCVYALTLEQDSLPAVFGAFLYCMYIFVTFNMLKGFQDRLDANMFQHL